MFEIKNKPGTELIDLFKHIFEGTKKDGIIECTDISNNTNSKIYLKENQVVYAHSTMRKAKFGDLMIKKGIITHKDLEMALDEQKKNPEKLIGSILVEMGTISERVIPNLLFHQIEAVIYEILSWNNCNIVFSESNVEKDKDFRRPITDSKKFVYSDLNKLLDSKSFITSLSINLPELLKIKKVLSDPNFIPKKIQKTYPAQLNFDQRKILRNIDNINTLNDIVILSDLDYFKTYQILFFLFNEKIITVPLSKNQVVKNEEKETVKYDIIKETVNPFEEQLINSAKQKNNIIEDDKNVSLQEYKILLSSAKNEIKNLSEKLSLYESTKLVLPEDINKRILGLTYNKKVMLSNIIKNMLDLME